MSHGDCSAAAASMPSGCSSSRDPRRPELPQRDAGGPVVVVSEDRGASVHQVRWDTAAAASIGSLRSLESLTTHLDGTAVHRRGGGTVVDCSRGSTNPSASSHLSLLRRSWRRCCSLFGSLSAASRRRPSWDARGRARTPVQPCTVWLKQDGLGRYTYSKTTARFDASDAG
jgi:hypothetical protein